MSQKFINLIYTILKSDNIIIFGKTYCSHCSQVINIFDQLQHRYTVIQLDLRADGEDIQHALKKITGERTVPRVFINQKFIGGCCTIQTLQNSGKLEEILQGAQRYNFVPQQQQEECPCPK